MSDTTTRRREVTVSVRIPASLAKVIDASAAGRGRSRSEEVRLALEVFAELAMLADADAPELREHLGDRHEEWRKQIRANVRSKLREAFGDQLPAVDHYLAAVEGR